VPSIKIIAVATAMSSLYGSRLMFNFTFYSGLKRLSEEVTGYIYTFIYTIYSYLIYKIYIYFI